MKIIVAVPLLFMRSLVEAALSSSGNVTFQDDVGGQAKQGSCIRTRQLEAIDPGFIASTSKGFIVGENRKQCASYYENWRTQPARSTTSLLSQRFNSTRHLRLASRKHDCRSPCTMVFNRHPSKILFRWFRSSVWFAQMEPSGTAGEQGRAAVVGEGVGSDQIAGRYPSKGQ